MSAINYQWIFLICTDPDKRIFLNNYEIDMDFSIKDKDGHTIIPDVNPIIECRPQSSDKFLFCCNFIISTKSDISLVLDKKEINFEENLVRCDNSKYLGIKLNENAVLFRNTDSSAIKLQISICDSEEAAKHPKFWIPPLFWMPCIRYYEDAPDNKYPISLRLTTLHTQVSDENLTIHQYPIFQ